MTSALLLPACTLPVFLLVAAATAQTAAAERCETAPISFIFIDNRSIFDTSDPELDDRFEWAYDVANALHVRTRVSVIRRELLFGLGECYDPLLLEESERLLRAYNFLSRVDVFAVPQPDSTVHVVVDTQDEWSTQVDLRFDFDDGLEFEGFELRESNLLGTGQTVGLFFLEREAAQDYGLFYHTPQLFGTRWDLTASGGRSRAGTFVTASIAYPFVGEVGRWAGRQGFAREDRFFDYVADGSPDDERHVLSRLRDKWFDLAVISRLGEPGRLTRVGGALIYRDLTFPDGRDAVQVVEEDDFDDRVPADAALVQAVAPQRMERHELHLLLLLGQRNIRWVQRGGFDSLRGEEDIRLGFDAEVAAGPSLPVFERDDDIFTRVTFYGASEPADALVATRFQADARHDFGRGADPAGWEDIIAQGEILTYWKPERLPRQTFLFRAAGTGGWHTRTPFQITLGGDRGVRGYASERFPGGRRAVFNLEDRIFFGWPFPDVLDLGGTVFVDAGRIWPGDVPFGVDSGWRASAGAGLRIAFPAGGRRTYRIDLALPLGKGAGWDDLRLILSVGEMLGLASEFGEPRLGRSRRDVSAQPLYFPK